MVDEYRIFAVGDEVGCFEIDCLNAQGGHAGVKVREVEEISNARRV